MVFLCKVSPEILDSALNRVVAEEALELDSPSDSVTNSNSAQGTYVLKIKLCCDSCNQKLRKILKIKGLETVDMDVQEDLVKVKGTVDITEVRSYIKDELKKDAVIIFPAEVVIPTEKDDCAAHKKEKDAGTTRKKDRDDEATNKKGNGNNGTFDKEYKDAITVYEKFEGISMVYEKNEGIDAVDEKTKGKATVDMNDKGTTQTDAKSTGRATSDDKHKDGGKEKGKDYVFNDEKNKTGGRYKKQHRRDKDGGAMRNENPKKYPNYYEYDYYCPLKYSNGIDQMFSDENPNSYCSIM